MLRKKYSLIIFVFFFASQLLSNGPIDKHRHKKSGNGVRINFGTGLNFYHLNDKHGIYPKQKANGVAAIRRELRVIRDYKTYLLFGADYIFHGVGYQSYYFKPDSVKLYDRKYSYNYSLFMNEIHIPIEIKYLLRREDNSLFSPYLLVGYHFRYLLPARVRVTRDGEVYKDDRPDMKFRTYLFSEKINATLSASLGWQKNNLSDSRGSFFAEINFQYGFSDYYFESNYSASSMYINSTQVMLLIGAKF